MNNFEQNNQMEISDTQPQSSSSSSQNTWFTLKIIEYLSLAFFVGLSIIALTLPRNPIIIIIDAISLAIFVFLFFVDQQISQTARQTAYQDEIQKKAELYLIIHQIKIIKNPIVPAREKALNYAQELIKDYKKTRTTSRNLYYGLQIGTIIL